MKNGEEKIPALRFVLDGTVSKHRGFLPCIDPLNHFGFDDPVTAEYEETSRTLPKLLYDGEIRARLDRLPPLASETLLNDEEAKLAFRMLSFFISAYAWADCARDVDAPQVKTIPENLAVPMNRLATRLGMKPILAYWMYAMYNFRTLNSEKPVRFDNLELLQHFTIPPWDKDESGFILPHVEIEAEAGPGLCAIADAHLAAARDDAKTLTERFAVMASALREMSETFRTIPSVCNPDHYYLHVRPWIFYFQNITYAGVGSFERLKGETGAESTVIPSFDRALGVEHKATSLTAHLEELKMYRPPEQAAWLRAIEEGPSLKQYVLKNRHIPELKDAFNDVHEAMVEFRREHFNAAIQYIKQKGRGTVATGGTHYERFLGDLIKETRENMLV